jgi:hypothetical protein
MTEKGAPKHSRHPLLALSIKSSFGGNKSKESQCDPWDDREDIGI